MDTQSILNKVEQGRPEVGWAIFSFHSGPCLVSLLGNALLTLVMLGFAAVMGYFLLTGQAYAQYGDEANVMLFGGVVLGFFGIYFLWKILKLTRIFLAGKSNCLVLTDQGIIKRLAGKVESYQYSHIENLILNTITGRSITPKREIHFWDDQANRQVQLVDGNYFGNPQQIFQILRGKLD